jgi:CRISPR-associated protein Cmr2
MFTERVNHVTEQEGRRYIVSTHTMALATTLQKLATLDTVEKRAGLQTLAAYTDGKEPVALPRRLLRQVLQSPESEILRRLPATLDAAREADDERAYDSIKKAIERLAGDSETYYALILMDGDRMGAWLSGEFATRFQDCWHPQVRNSVTQRFRDHARLKDYLEARRPPSPGRHLAISQALNDFTTRIVPYIVEEQCNGKLLYAGGDDVLAMVTVSDLPKAMLLLRLAYSGIGIDDLAQLQIAPDPTFRLDQGFAILRGRLLRMMGVRATTSMGAVIAHHQAPLAAVLRDLREAESRAKASGRNAFCLRVVKRGGGETGFTAPWWLDDEPSRSIARTPLGILLRTRDALAGGPQWDGMSRRAVYLAHEWLKHLPDWPGSGHDAEWQAMTGSRLALQFSRQGGPAHLAQDLVTIACQLASRSKTEPRGVLADLLSSAEFLAREVRANGDQQ